MSIPAPSCRLVVVIMPDSTSSSAGTPESFLPVHLVFEANGGVPFPVIEAEVELALGECFSIRLVVKSPTPDARLTDFLRSPVSVRFDGEGEVPAIRGIVRKARLLSVEPGGVTLFEVRVAPPYFRLEKRRNHRIFMALSVFEIADTVLAEHGLEPLITGTHTSPKREYTVQYGEDDWHLVRRLLADEGWILTPSLELGRLRVVADTRIEGPIAPDLPFIDHRVAKPSTPHAFEAELLTEVILGRAVTVDYDWQKPIFVVEGEKQLSQDLDLENYEYEVGEASTDADAGKRADDTIRAAHSQNHQLACSTNCLLPPGARLKILGHPRYELDDPYVAVRSRSTWAPSASGEVVARHAYQCLDAVHPYKPLRLDKPRIHGVQTARVVGEPGAEIDVDEHGRVIVEFFWDRRRLGSSAAAINASRRIRVSSAWAGAGYGFEALPRVGDEVIVAYLDGDADQPLVVGRVHNPTRPNPLSLPAEKTASVWRSRSTPGGDGFNEIRMEDRAGAELLSMHAQQDFASAVERDAKTTVARDESRFVGRDFTSRTMGTGDMGFERGFRIDTPNGGSMSAKTLELRGHRSCSVATATNALRGGEVTIEAKGLVSIDGKPVTIHGDTIKLTAGASSIELGNDGITISGPKITIKASGDCNVNGSAIFLNC